TGSVRQWNLGARGPDRGGDAFGRVEFASYFRPPGSPGAINFSTANAATYGAIGYGNWTFATGVLTPWTAAAPPSVTSQYQPDVTNNLLHGFEGFRFPNQAYPPPPNTTFTPQTNGGTPADLNVGANYVPTDVPSYDVKANSQFRSDGLNEADELNLYQLN